MTKIYCKYDTLSDPKSLKDHNRNNNKHGQDQIERLSELYKYHGIRHPIIVSKLSGMIVAGHARKLSAIRAGIKEFPVVYQDFESSEAEYAFLTSDNAIALWSDLDLSLVNLELENLGPDFNIDMLGLKDFKIDISEVGFPELSSDDKSELQQITFTVHNEQMEVIKQALEKVDYESELNTNKNGNAIFFICEKFLELNE